MGSSIKGVRTKSDFLDPPPLYNIVRLEAIPPSPVHGRPDRIAHEHLSKSPKHKIFYDPEIRGQSGGKVGV